MCSRINGHHVSLFAKKVNNLVVIMQAEYEENDYLKHYKEVLKLLPKVMSFWKKVYVDSPVSYVLSITEYENNMMLFYHHGSFGLHTNSTLGDGETFYSHVAKHYVPRMARWTLEHLGYGVWLWTMQGFEHRNKESKHVHAHKTNGKGNCCMQVLKGMHESFLHK